MSLRLPPQSSPLRAMFDVSDVLPFGMPGGLLKAPTFWQCRASAAAMIADGGVRSVQAVCLRANGALELVQFGPKGGHETLWRFA